jgi:hypothetical protein
MTNYFFDPAPIATGVKQANDIETMLQEAAAHNALIKQYGPIAGDLGAATQAQAYGFNEQANPLRIQNAQLQNTAAQAENQYNALNRPLLLQGQTLQNQAAAQANRTNALLDPERVRAAGLTNDTTAQALGTAQQIDPLRIQGAALQNQGAAQTQQQSAAAFPLEQQARGQAIDENAIKIASANMTLHGQQAAQTHGVLATSLDSLAAASQNVTDPNQLSAIWDGTVARTAALIGADPAQVAQQLAPYRTQFLQNGAGIVPQIKQELDASIYAAMKPEDRAKYQEAVARTAAVGADVALKGAQTDLAKARADESRVKAITTKFGDPAEISKQIGASTFLNSRVGNVIGTVQPGANGGAPQYGSDGLIGQALALMQNLPNDGAALKAQSFIPGTQAYQLKAIMEQIGSNTSIDDLRAMKQSGLSLGQVRVAEFLGVAKAIANTDLGTGIPRLRQQLGKLGGMYTQLYNSNNADIETQRSHLQQLQGGGVATPGPQPAAPGGVVATPGPQTSNDGPSPAYTSKVFTAESDNDPTARNPRSSATGLAQFTDATWDDLRRRHPEAGFTPDGRTNPVQAARALQLYTTESADYFGNRGLPVNDTTLYMAHVFGRGGASRVLNAKPDTPASRVLPPSVLKANPGIAKMNAGDVALWAHGKMLDDEPQGADPDEQGVPPQALSDAALAAKYGITLPGGA